MFSNSGQNRRYVCFFSKNVPIPDFHKQKANPQAAGWPLFVLIWLLEPDAQVAIDHGAQLAELWAIVTKDVVTAAEA